MNITSCPEFKSWILNKIEAREFKERTGVHCSDLIYCLNKQALRRLHPTKAAENDLLLFSLGWATQRWLTGQDTDLPEIVKDGIIVTRDAEYIVSSDEGTCYAIPWELKATFTSSEKPIDDNIAWVRQIQAQCTVSGVRQAMLSRFEIMGNWKSIFGKKDDKDKPENRKPTLTAVELSFTQDELDRNWAWLCGRRDSFLALLGGAALLPKAAAIPSGQEYECTRCAFRGKECIG